MEPNVQYGVWLVVGIFLMEVVRSWSLALTWALNYRTGVRLRGAILTMAFKKILKLKSIKEKSLGEVNENPSFGQRHSVQWDLEAVFGVVMSRACSRVQQYKLGIPYPKCWGTELFLDIGFFPIFWNICI